MIKKMTLLATVIALVALAGPALASAAPQVTYPAGTTLATGTAITATSTSLLLTASLGGTQCAKVSFPAKLTKNSGTLVEAAGSGEATTTTCTFNGESINATDYTLTNLKISTSGRGTATLSFKQDLPFVGTCTYTGTNAPFTYASGGDTISFTKATLTASPSACGTAKLDADFTLERTAGGALILD